MASRRGIMKHCRGVALAGFAVLVSAVVLAVPGLGAAAAEKVVVIARGLDNPRGLTVADDGSVYVAEAGRAGPRCFPGGAEGEERCFGFTGAITRIAGGKQERAYTGFLSAGGKDGSFTVDVDDVAVGPGGRVYAIMSSAGPSAEEMLGERGARQSGKLLRLTRSGYKAVVATVEQYEFVHDPDGGAVDSNPYSLAVTSNRRSLPTRAQTPCSRSPRTAK